jgi:uncharacterized protein YcbK (DUF882 family)
MIRQKKRKGTVNYLLFLVPISIFMIIGVFILRNKIIQRNEMSHYVSDCNHVKYANVSINPSKRLNDSNEVQMVHALKNGLKNPFTSKAEFNAKFDSLKRHSILFEVTDSKFYQLKELKYSLPFLIPEAIDMLDEIGYRFQEKLKEKKQNYYRFRITSLLRTEEDQNKLHHHNGNAAEHSTHLYGTTVDISYKNFYNIKNDTVESSFEAVQALTKVLIDMRQECRLLAVRERHQSCFHITVVVCQPDLNKKTQDLAKK